ncbi:hypothetical protein AGLY_017474 [Aphis glycines]|uniref:Uncharacterized protein n=1 Tax=Aphis glycines TaxID=307491 RepID=A0A6G0SUR4_APHGL|nr:hypothetical protein AGLY_017474 [Aphis glycines]
MVGVAGLTGLKGDLIISGDLLARVDLTGVNFSSVLDKHNNSVVKNNQTVWFTFNRYYAIIIFPDPDEPIIKHLIDLKVDEKYKANDFEIINTKFGNRVSIIKIIKGSIHLKHYISNENNDMSIGLYAISFTNSNNLIKIENECQITINNNNLNFIRTSTKSMIYYPLNDEHYINIEKDCEFTVKTEKLVLTTYKIPIGVYSIREIENLLNCDKNIRNTKLTIVGQFLKISTNYEYDFDNHTTESPFNRTVTGTIELQFYTQSFLKDINGIKIQLINNYISITSNDYYLLDENLRLSLGFDDKCAYTHTGSDIILSHYFVNKFLEVHCDIIEKSISNHKTDQYLHRDDDVLCVIKCDNEEKVTTIIQKSAFVCLL